MDSGSAMVVETTAAAAMIAAPPSSQHPSRTRLTFISYLPYSLPIKGLFGPGTVRDIETMPSPVSIPNDDPKRMAI